MHYFSEIWRNIIIKKSQWSIQRLSFWATYKFRKTLFAFTMQKLTTFLYSMNTETYGSFTKAQLSRYKLRHNYLCKLKAKLSMQIEHLAISMGSTWRESFVGGKLDKKVQLLRLPFNSRWINAQNTQIVVRILSKKNCHKNDLK